MKAGQCLGNRDDVNSIRIILADDHRLVRSALAHLMNSFHGVCVVGEVRDTASLVDMVAKVSAEVVFVDAAMPSLKGSDTTRRLLTIAPELHVVVMSAYASDPFIRQTLENGACGFLHKDAAIEDLESAIRKAANGERFIVPALEHDHLSDPVPGSLNPAVNWDPLTSRQRQVLHLVARGYRSKSIAERLAVSVKTIEAHRAEIMRRLGVRNLAGLVQEAIRLGLV